MFEKLAEWWEERKRQAYARKIGAERVGEAKRGRIYRREGEAPGGQVSTEVEPEVEVSARILRADGTVEDLGRIA